MEQRACYWLITIGSNLWFPCQWQCQEDEWPPTRVQRAKDGLHVIDSLQLSFIHVIPMPTIITEMLGLGVSEWPPTRAQRAPGGAHVIDSLELNGRPPVRFACCFFLLMFFAGKPINPVRIVPMDVHCCTALTLGGRAVNIEGISVDHPFLKFLD